MGFIERLRYFTNLSSKKIELTQIYARDESKKHNISIELSESGSFINISVLISGKFTPEIEQQILDDWECIDLIESQVLS